MRGDIKPKLWLATFWRKREEKGIMAYEYDRIKVEVDGRLAIVTISNPPINIITAELAAELYALTVELKADPDLTVVVFKSADPDFFLAHYDVANILTFPTDSSPEKDNELNTFHVMCERV
ncbi:MAG: enoyl-CoA hydratase/carnithine racemase, partial [Candidatus Azotimanducaceae bacterium]